MDSEIHGQDIVVLEDNLLASRVWGPVSGYVIQAEPGWKPHTGFESVSCFKALVVSQCANAVLNLVGKMAHGNPGLGDCLHVLADLAVDFSGFAVVVEELVIHAVHD